MRRLLFLTIGFAILIIIILNINSWIIYDKMRLNFDDQLGERLVSLAQVLALTAESYSSPDNFARLDSLFTSALKENHLYNIFIVNDSLLFLYNAKEKSKIDQSDIVLKLNQKEIVIAAAGFSQASRLYDAGGYFLKSGFAAIKDPNRTTSLVLGVEADADFFKVLFTVRNQLFITNLISLLLIVSLSISFGQLTNYFVKTERSILRANTLNLMGQMAATVAHEIKNPLSIIRATSERIKHKYGSAEEPMFNYIEEEVDRLNNTIVNYLALGTGQELKIESIRPDEIIKDIIGQFEHEAKKGIVLETTFHEPVSILGNRSTLRQAFFNIIINAIQALPQGGTISINSVVKKIKQRDFLVFEFKDTGPGIPRQFQKKSFEPFFSTKDKGSGLGLYIVRNIIEQHKGMVKLESKQGQGTKVILSFPL